MLTEAGVRRQRRRTRRQWQRVMAAQASSGLSQQAYCKRHGIAYSTFCRWKHKLTTASGASTAMAASSAFVELTPAVPDAGLRWDVELELGEGVYLRVRRG